MEKTKLYCIAYGCPQLKRMEDCPLIKIEHLSFQEKLSWLERLSDEIKLDILLHHAFCTKKSILQNNK